METKRTRWLDIIKRINPNILKIPRMLINIPNKKHRKILVSKTKDIFQNPDITNLSSTNKPSK